MTVVGGGRVGAGTLSPSSAAGFRTADTFLKGHNGSGDNQKHIYQHPTELHLTETGSSYSWPGPVMALVSMPPS